MGLPVLEGKSTGDHFSVGHHGTAGEDHRYLLSGRCRCVIGACLIGGRTDAFRGFRRAGGPEEQQSEGVHRDKHRGAGIGEDCDPEAGDP